MVHAGGIRLGFAAVSVGGNNLDEDRRALGTLGDPGDHRDLLHGKLSLSMRAFKMLSQQLADQVLPISLPLQRL